jgi:4-amino-4-deoxy-L-arabinose transferase-like glycosyltransferase
MPKRVKTAEKHASSHRNLVILLVAICGIAILIGTLAFDRLPSTIGDNAEFMILGRALAAGEGFRYMSHPDARPATKYPPGFPLMLAGWIKVFGNSILSMKINVLVCYVAAVVMTFLLGRRLLGDALGMMAALLLTSSWTVLMYSHQVLSDIPYAMLSLVVVLLFLSLPQRRSTMIAGTLICIWAYFVRTAGVSLVAATVIFLMLKRRRREGLLLLGGFVLVSVLWAVRNYTMTGEGSRYMGVLLAANPYDPDKGLISFTGLIGRAWTNLTGYAGWLLPLNLLPVAVTSAADAGGTALRTVVSLIIVAISILGGYTLRRKTLLISLYLIIYVAVYLAWPDVWMSERFMIPVAPFLAIYLFAGCRRIIRYFEAKHLAVMILCAVLVLTNVYTLAGWTRRARGYPPGWSEYLETAQWVREYTPEQSVVMCRKPFMFYLFSDRKTIAYPFTRDGEVMRKHLADSRPDYIVLEDFGGGTSTTEVYLVPVLKEMLAYLENVYATGEPVNMVLKFTPPGPEGER